MSKIKRIAIIGVGAIGGTIGACLLREGHDVTLIDTWGDHVEAVKRHGLTLANIKETFNVPANALHINEVSTIFRPFDLIITGVKAYDVRWSTHLMEPLLKHTGCVLVTQNGFVDPQVADIVGYPRAVGCVVTMGGGVYKPGHVCRTDPMSANNFSLGEFSGIITPRIKQIAYLLNSVGPCVTTSNIWGNRWAKLAVNCMGNALSGLIDRQEQALTSEQEDILKSIQAILACETVRVGLAVGIAVESVRGIPAESMARVGRGGDLREVMDMIDAQTRRRRLSADQVARIGAPSRASLQQDVIKGRRTEVDYLNGFVVKKAAEVGVDVPMNSAVTDLTHQLEREGRQPSLKALEYLGNLL